MVLFPGYLALYEEGRDEKADDEDGARMPALRAGDAPAKTGVEATQNFTQPPPRYSEASLVKRLEELGIGRPSTYAATLQTLKDREYVGIDKNRFIPEESGRLVTAFLERFFERYVNYDYTAELEEGLDDVSGGRARLAEIARGVLARLQAQGRRGHGAEAVRDHRGARRIPRAVALSRKTTTAADPRLCPACGNGRLALRGGKFGAFVACSNYPECRYTQKFGQGGGEGAERGPDRARQRHHPEAAGASGPTSSRARARTPSAHRCPRMCRPTG